MMMYSVGLARKIGQHVVHASVRRLDVNFQRELQSLWKRERSGLPQVVDLLLDLSQRLAGGLEPALGDRILHLQQHDADVLRAADAAETHQQIFFALVQLSVNEDDGFSAVIAGVDGFGDELRMLGQALVSALLSKDLGFVAEHQHDLVFYVHAGIIVVLKLVGRSAVAGKHDRTGERARRRKIGRHKILIERQRPLPAADVLRQTVVGFQLRAGSNGERLQISIGAGRL